MELDTNADTRGTGSSQRAVDNGERGLDRGPQVRLVQDSGGLIDTDRLFVTTPPIQNVWASGLHTFRTVPVIWNHALNFIDMNGLIDELSQRRLTSIHRIGIVTHGDSNGVVQFPPDITHLNIRSDRNIRSLIQRFGTLLSPTASIIIYGCLAGRGQEGNTLLIEISNLLPGRTIIGFTTVSAVGPSGNAGDIRDTGLTAYSGGLSVSSISRLPLQNEQSDSAKWARNGAIVRPAPNDDLAFLRQEGRIR